MFKETFGYDLAVNPLTFSGMCVKKSNLNGLHNGQIIKCPVSKIEKGAVYEKVINNIAKGGSLIQDMRLPILKDNIPFAYLKYRPLEQRFRNTNLRTELAATETVMSKDEKEKVILFCKKMGLEYGELDTVRDVVDKKLYILDVNNTPYGPPNHLSFFGYSHALRSLAENFEKYFNPRKNSGSEGILRTFAVQDMAAIKKIVKKILPSFLQQSVKKNLINILRITRLDLCYFYDEKFATTARRNKYWVNEFSEVILNTFSPKSIIDFGCGTGDILFPFEQKGLEILGVDGSNANRRHCKIKKGNFVVFDIRNKCKNAKKYDLCLCLEVAEHIDERFSNILIDNLTRSSATLIFTAAHPGQLGTDHINLKPYGWWIKKFQQFNFKFEEALTGYLKKEFANIRGIHRSYIDNLLIFKSAQK